jgi:hypothetical protein
VPISEKQALLLLFVIVAVLASRSNTSATLGSPLHAASCAKVPHEWQTLHASVTQQRIQAVKQDGINAHPSTQHQSVSPALISHLYQPFE